LICGFGSAEQYIRTARSRNSNEYFLGAAIAALDPKWAGGRPRLVSDDERKFIVATARTRPVALGCPFTHWSLRKLADYLARNRDRRVRIGRERLRQILREHGISFQRTAHGRSPPILTRTPNSTASST
jgi:transposase